MIKLIVLDVDGCMTDGSLTFNNEGIESKTFNVKDGLGITTWLKIGNDVAIITGRESKIVQRRSKELGVVHLFQNVKNKKVVLENLITTLGYRLDEIAIIGDDLNDIGMLKLVKHSFAPNDASEYVKNIVNNVLISNGGKGAIREMIDILVRYNNQEEEFLKVWS